MFYNYRPPTPKEEEEGQPEATNEIVDTGSQDEACALPESNNKFDINDFLNFDSALPPLLSVSIRILKHKIMLLKPLLAIINHNIACLISMIFRTSSHSLPYFL